MNIQDIKLKRCYNRDWSHSLKYLGYTWCFDIDEDFLADSLCAIWNDDSWSVPIMIKEKNRIIYSDWQHNKSAVLPSVYDSTRHTTLGEEINSIVNLINELETKGFLNGL